MDLLKQPGNKECNKDNVELEETSKRCETNLQSLLKEELNEYKARMNKSNNVIIIGQAEDNTESIQTVQNWITTTLQLDNKSIKVQEIRRLGSDSKNQRPILVKLQDKQQQKLVLKNTKHLKNLESPTTNKIYINPDLTKQQHAERFLKRELPCNTQTQQLTTKGESNCY